VTATSDRPVARIARAAVVPGHDGSAELFVEIEYPSGGRASLSLNAEVALAAADQAGVADLGQLVGMPWHVLVGGLDGARRLTKGD
jgi:hypothetical protein